MREQTKNSEKFYFGRLREKLEKQRQEQYFEDKKESNEEQIDEEDSNCDETSYNESSRVERQQSAEFEIELDDVPMEEEEEVEGAVDEGENLVDDLNLSIESLEEIEIEQVIASTHVSPEIPSSSCKTKRKLKKVKLFSIQCAICSKTSSKKSKLRQHIEAVHEKKKRFMCDYCPIGFYIKKDLVRHITPRHIFDVKSKKFISRNDESKRFKCKSENCGKSYLSTHSLKRHQNSEC